MTRFRRRGRPGPVPGPPARRAPPTFTRAGRHGHPSMRVTVPLLLWQEPASLTSAREADEG